MKQFFVASLMLCTAGVCAAQTAQNTSQPALTQSAVSKHYRLTFVLDYPQNQKPAQTFTLDVPVTPGLPGVAALSSTSGVTGQMAGGAKQTIQCTDVRETATGLAADVDIAMDSIAAAPLPGSKEPIQSHIAFQKKVDLALATPTRITGDLHRLPLGNGDAAQTIAAPPAPQITMTAVETD